MSGLGRRSSVSGQPLAGWRVASKGLGPLPRRRGSALAHGCGRSGRELLPLARAAAVSTGLSYSTKRPLSSSHASVSASSNGADRGWGEGWARPRAHKHPRAHPPSTLPAYLEVAADTAQHIHRRRVLACSDARARARPRARARVRVRVVVRVVLVRVRVSWPAVMLPVSQVTTVRVSMAPSLSAW